MATMKFLIPGSATWNRVWGRVAEKFGDNICECKQTGETWQYMGSVVGDSEVEHQFRHRSLPAKSGSREYFSTRTALDGLDDYQ